MKKAPLKYNLFTLLAYKCKLNFFDFVLWGLIIILSGFINPLSLLFKQNFIDGAINSYNTNSGFKQMVSYIIPILCIYFYYFINTPIKELLNNKIERKLRENLTFDMNSKKSRIKYEYIENSKASNLIDRVLNEPEKRILEYYQSIFTLVAGFVSITGTIIIISMVDWWICICLLLVALPSYYLAYNGGKKEYSSTKDISEIKRYCDYLAGIPLERENAHERELFGFVDYINKQWEYNLRFYKKKLLDTQLKVQTIITTSGVASNIFIGLVFFLLLIPLKQKVITIGFYISASATLLYMNNYISKDIIGTIKQLTKDKLFFSEINSFYQMEETPDVFENKIEPRSFETIEFKNVYFKYPGSEEYILKDFNLTIHSGLHYAIVGYNGAGKSTLIKILLGLYKVDAGDVLINNISINKMKQSEINGFFSVVFQDFAKYYVSIRDNIAIGNMNKFNNDIKIFEASNMGGSNEFVSKLDNKFDTVLGKIYEGGIDISGGQWQKIAYSRSFMSSAPVKILDEPTASLDPISESKLYREYAALSKKQTTIFITHRLASTSLADKIVVINNCTVEEMGNHEELIKMDRLYSKMFETQKKWYSEEYNMNEYY
ncbi:ABC transporter ATP-binding protein [Anaerocolumna chitinilytica]|uniref:ABC transporter ATP-binding protein n=1 Tax=Anaerocolumna chitinilytica TaxID=1727145 RepID=A0A7M3SA69_9FIRM|nr:ABC transporter ATP-binding protein [Anaerocolumna chitinilytica]BCK01487.1 ABC transporter ATP-binding protein [Anaerocolumna chitinilytica]